MGKGLTQAQLANQVGVHEQTIGNIERGTVDVSPDVLARVEETLEIELDPSRLASLAAVEVIMDQVESKLADLDNTHGLVFVGELLQWVTGWPVNTRAPAETEALPRSEDLDPV